MSSRYLLMALLLLTTHLPAAETPIRGMALTGEQVVIDPQATGRPVLLVFWASWCAACVREMPALMRIHANAREHIDLVSCTIDEDAGPARMCVERLSLTYPVIHDPVMRIADHFAVDATPTMIVLGVDGSVIARGRSLAQVTKRLANLGVELP